MCLDHCSYYKYFEQVYQFILVVNRFLLSANKKLNILKYS